MRPRASSEDFWLRLRAISQTPHVFRIGNASIGACSGQLRADAIRRAGVREEYRSERGVLCAAGHELERITAGPDSTHPDDRHAGGLRTDAHRMECDGF